MTLAVSEYRPGVVLARFERAEDLSPAQQAPLLDALRASGRAAPATGLVMEMHHQIRKVDPGAPSFWLRLSQDPEARLAAVVVVTEALSVRAAARGFGLAQQVVGSRVRVEVFPALDQAEAWLGTALAESRPPSTPAPALPPESVAEGGEAVVWGQAVEGLIRAVGANRDPALLAELSALGFELSGRPKSSYPRESFLLALDVVATRLWGEKGAEAAMVELGKAWVMGFNQTLVGRSMLAFVRALGPRRAVQRLTQSFRTANNYTDAEAIELGLTEFEVRLHPVYRPGFFTGILTAGLEASGAKEPSVALVEAGELKATYRLSWSR